MTPKITISDGCRFIKKLEACESMSAKLVLLRGFCDKYALESHAPSGLNRNDTIEYWMTRATTAELKLQEFMKLLDENEPEHAFDAIASPDPGPTLFDGNDYEDQYDDEVFCGSCGRLVTDGGGLYCSAFCEALGPISHRLNSLGASSK